MTDRPFVAPQPPPGSPMPSRTVTHRPRRTLHHRAPWHLALTALLAALLLPTLPAAAQPFGGGTDVGYSSGVESVFATDLDGDGDTDVIAVSSSDFDDAKSIEWYENDGATNPSFTRSYIAYDDVESAFVADIDGDKNTDVLAIRSNDYNDENSIVWYQNDGALDPSFSERTITTARDTIRSVFATDLDGDGDTDVLSAVSDGYNNSDSITWYENDGADDPSFDYSNSIADLYDGSVQRMLATDLDGDGDTDVLSAASDGYNNSDRITWYENDGADDPSFSSDYDNSIDELYDVQHVLATDLDGDGDTDVLTASYDNYDNSDRIRWYENDGADDPSFSSDYYGDSIDELYDNSFRDMLATDLDGDGDTDVLVAFSSDDDGSIVWYKNEWGRRPIVYRKHSHECLL